MSRCLRNDGTAIRVFSSTRDRLFRLKGRRTYDEYINEVLDEKFREQESGNESDVSPSDSSMKPTETDEKESEEKTEKPKWLKRGLFS